MLLLDFRTQKTVSHEDGGLRGVGQLRNNFEYDTTTLFSHCHTGGEGGLAKLKACVTKSNQTYEFIIAIGNTCARQ